MHWETRYSACEMFHLDIVGEQVRTYLDTPASAHCYTFEQVLAGEMDTEIRAVFGGDILDELKAIVNRKMKRAAWQQRVAADGKSPRESPAKGSMVPQPPARAERERKAVETWGAGDWSSARPASDKSPGSPKSPPQGKP